MKLLKSYIGLICIVSLTISCNNILDTTPTNLLTDPDVWRSKDAIDAYVGKLYDEMQVEDLEYQLVSEGQYLSEFTDEAVGIDLIESFGFRERSEDRSWSCSPANMP